MIVIAALLVTVGFLTAQLLAKRKKPPAPPPKQLRRVQVAAPSPVLTPFVRRPGASGAMAAGAGGAAAGAGVEVAAKAGAMPLPGGPMACPSCRRQFESGVSFCPHDSRRLVPAGELAERVRPSGSACPRCRRAYDAGIRYCPHDAEELIPLTLWEATKGKKQTVPTGVVAKICPRCGNRYDLATAFCGKDGSELVTIN